MKRKKKKSARAMPRTFASLFPGASRRVPGGEVKRTFRIGGSGVAGEPEDAPWTREVVAFLEASGIVVERECIMGMNAADMHTLKADFLDGGLGAQTGPYIGGDRSAWIHGPRAAQFVAVGLGLVVPKRLVEPPDGSSAKPVRFSWTDANGDVVDDKIHSRSILSTEE
ncbi:MAG: hypothetical protein Q8O67_31800 [Deltaproteobacteria bacterium]|nr:hypothetical protein [Deltaproteobacteria bacterium]